MQASEISEKFATIFCKKGKKQKAIKIFKTLMEDLKLKKMKQNNILLNPFDILMNLILSCEPKLIVRNKRVGRFLRAYPSFVKKKKGNTNGY